MLSNAKLQKGLWEKIVTLAFYLVNQFHSIAIDYNNIEEVWTCHSCDYSNLNFFSCDAYALISKDHCSKLDPRSKKYIFVGYDEEAFEEVDEDEKK
jgi:hypothetical protein